MDNQTVEHWKTAIRGAPGIPAAADVRHVQDGNAIRIESDWLAGDDPERPHKRTRTLRIDVTTQASNMYDNADAAARVEADERFRAIAHNAVATFDPINDAPYGQVPAPHHVIIDIDTMFP